MTQALLAALFMVVQDILAVVLVQAEASDKKGSGALAAAMDALMWIVAISSTTIAVHSHGVEKIEVYALVTAANVVGTLSGKEIGNRLLKRLDSSREIRAARRA